MRSCATPKRGGSSFLLGSTNRIAGSIWSWGRNLINSVATNPFSSLFSSGQNQNQNQTSSAGGASLQASQLQYEAEQSGVLKITTAQGDTVSISFAALNEIESQSANASAGGSSASASNSEVASAYAASVQINGSLNSNEQSDITKLLGGLLQAMQDESSGNTAQAAQDLQGIGSLNSLQSFQFQWQQETQAQASTLSVLA
jgi:hypothetical protein